MVAGCLCLVLLLPTGRFFATVRLMLMAEVFNCWRYLSLKKQRKDPESYFH
jgi:hypothetical protein